MRDFHIEIICNRCVPVVHCRCERQLRLFPCQNIVRFNRKRYIAAVFWSFSQSTFLRSVCNIRSSNANRFGHGNCTFRSSRQRIPLCKRHRRSGHNSRRRGQGQQKFRFSHFNRTPFFGGVRRVIHCFYYMPCRPKKRMPGFHSVAMQIMHSAIHTKP